MMKHIAALFGALCMLTMFGCTVEKTEEGEAPKIEVEGGKMPKYDVDTAEVDVNQTTTTVTVPDVDVRTEQKTVTVPDVDIKMPNEQTTTP